MADGSLDFALRISADTRQGRAALRELQGAMQRTGSAGRNALDPFTQSVARATGGAADLRTQLAPLQKLLAFAGVSLGVGELIRLADTYSQMTARLRLATQYTGDFAEVQAALNQAARDTRAPLTETVDLYSRLAPSLAALGRTGAGAVGVVRTVNQAIALSGASATESQAALTQFGQALGSGVLRGDELNSILEQTPGLADAIAEGLGKTRGELRALGQQGALDAESVVLALERVAARVDADFAQLPMTVGQALVLLRNQLTEIVGEADQGSGALAALARAIVFVSDGIGTLASSGEQLRPLVEFVVDAVDGVARVFRIVATGIAGYTLAIRQALAGDLRGALATYRAIGDEVERILLEPLAAQKNIEGQAKTSANARLKVEQDLANAVARLEALRAVAAGRASADILLDDKQLAAARIAEGRKVLEEQRKGYEALRGDLRRVWDEAIAGARRAREEAAALLQQGRDARQAGVDKATDRRMRGMSDEDRDAFAGREARRLRDQADRSALFAQNAAISGRLDVARKLAAEAAKDAERAERFADQISDDDSAARLFEELGRIREDALKAEARVKQQEASAQENLATAINEQIAQNEARLAALRAELEKPVTIDADIAQAEQQVANLQKQLDKLGDKTITVTVKTVTEGGAPLDSNAAAALPGRAYGGPLPGVARGDRSDNVIYRGTPGEWVIQRPAVRYWGAAFMRGINNMRLPRFAYGGELGADQRAALADHDGASGKTPIVLQWPDGSRSPMSAANSVADEVLRVFRAAAMQRGRRK